MKISHLTFFGVFAIVLGVSCQPAKVIASVDKGNQPEARSFLKGEQIYVEVKVPLVSGVDTWQAIFPDGTPDGFSAKSNAGETVFSWIVPKDKITWFGTKGYTMKLTGAEYSRELNIRLINQSNSVAQWVIRIVSLGKL